MDEDEMRQTGPSADDQIASLLPFYLSGRLDGDDLARVEQWLETSPSAKQTLDNVNSERDVTVRSNEAIKPPAGALAKLNAQIERYSIKPRPSIYLSEIWDKVSQLFDFGDRRLAWATAFSLLVALLVQVPFMLNRAAPDSYGLAAGRDIMEVSNGATAVVIFTPDSTMSQISKHLSAHGARIISGPRGRSSYEITFEDEHPGGTKNERIKRFKENKNLVLLFTIKTASPK